MPYGIRLFDDLAGMHAGYALVIVWALFAVPALAASWALVFEGRRLPSAGFRSAVWSTVYIGVCIWATFTVPYWFRVNYKADWVTRLRDPTTGAEYVVGTSGSSPTVRELGFLRVKGSEILWTIDLEAGSIRRGDPRRHASRATTPLSKAELVSLLHTEASLNGQEPEREAVEGKAEDLLTIIKAAASGEHPGRVKLNTYSLNRGWCYYVSVRNAKGWFLAVQFLVMGCGWAAGVAVILRWSRAPAAAVPDHGSSGVPDQCNGPPRTDASE